MDDESEWLSATLQPMDDDAADEKIHLPLIRISAGLAKAADAIEGDILYISDSRWWLGGLKSGHGRISAIDADDDGITVHLGPGVRARIIVPGREAEPLKVKRLY